MARDHRYRKVAVDEAKLDAALVDVFLDTHYTRREEIVIGLDGTDGRVQGKQEGGEYHDGYYGRYCFLPLHITCGIQVLAVRVRRSKIDSTQCARGELKRVVERIRTRRPGVRIKVHGDSGFFCDRAMVWCEREEEICYVFGLARNPRLQRRIAEDLGASKAACIESGEASRRFRELRYRTLESLSREKRVVGKAEWLPGPRGSNPRFVVNDIPTEEPYARVLYEMPYSAVRGDRVPDQGAAARPLPPIELSHASYEPISRHLRMS